MNFLPYPKRPPLILLLPTTALVMMVMFYFGVRLKGMHPGNNVRWSAMGAGLAFDRYSMAYTNGFITIDDKMRKNGLTIEMAIQPKFYNSPYFSFVLLVNGGGDEQQLVIGQWRSSLLIMNGDDYSNKRRVPKIYIPLVKDLGEPQLIAIVSNKSGTRVYLNGKLKKTNHSLALSYPKSKGKARMVIGNSLQGNNPWMGNFSGLAMYDHALAVEIIQRHYLQWLSAKRFNSLQADMPRLLYVFDEGQGEKVTNKAGDGLDLEIPSEVQILRKDVLAWPRLGSVATPGMMEDILVNFIGFIPLGLLLIAIISQTKRFGTLSGALVAVLIAACFSLCIELVQVWIPTRDSSMLDLILNTLGGAAGVALFQWINKQMAW